MVFRSEPIPASAPAALTEALNWLTDFLAPTGFVAGTRGPTVADAAVLATVTSVAATDDTVVDLSKFPAVLQWVERMRKALPDITFNAEGCKFLGDTFRAKLAEVQSRK